MHTSVKVILGLIGVAIVGLVGYAIFRKDEENVIDQQLQGLPADEAKVLKEAKLEDADTKVLPKSDYIGEFFKSKTDNIFKVYTQEDKTKDVRQDDGTFRRQTAPEWVNTGKKYHVSDGEKIGKVLEETNRGFYIQTPVKTVVWAPKRLLYQ